MAARHRLEPAGRLRRPALGAAGRAAAGDGLERRTRRPRGSSRCRDREPAAGGGPRAGAGRSPRGTDRARTSRVGHDPALRPDDGLAVSTWVWLAPGAPAGRRRALIATWGEGGDGWALVLDPDGRPRFEVGADGRRDSVAGTEPVERGAWALLEAELDPATGTIAVAHGRRRGRRLETVEVARAQAETSGPGRARARCCSAPSLAPRASPAPISTASSTGRRSRPGPAARPRSRPGTSARVAGRASSTAGPRGLHGACVNGPLRAVTGHDWRGDVHDWRLAPEQYGAMHFHSDAVDDLGWPPSFELELPRVAAGRRLRRSRSRRTGSRTWSPFAVRRAAARRAGGERRPAPDLHLPGLLLRARGARRRRLASDPRTAGWREAGLRCLYDRHADGVGVYEASLLRPLTQLRPGYRCPQHGGPHGLAQDLILIGWLRAEGHRVRPAHRPRPRTARAPRRSPGTAP